MQEVNKSGAVVLSLTWALRSGLGRLCSLDPLSFRGKGRYKMFAKWRRQSIRVVASAHGILVQSASIIRGTNRGLHRSSSILLVIKQDIWRTKRRGLRRSHAPMWLTPPNTSTPNAARNVSTSAEAITGSRTNQRPHHQPKTYDFLPHALIGGTHHTVSLEVPRFLHQRWRLGEHRECVLQAAVGGGHCCGYCRCRW